jgi:hypothetical protein
VGALGVIYLLVGLALGAMVFRLSIGSGWHWAVGLLLGLIPIAATFFLGLIGLLGAGLFVGALYQATA